MLYTLQVYRGIAAMLVVLFHITVEMNNQWSYSNLIVDFLRFGHSGVEFFFVLSGFIIYYIHKSEIGEGLKYFKSYAIKRFTRIFPFYWFLLFSLGLLYYVFPSRGADFHHSLESFLYSIFIIPQSHPHYISVAWTLSHELLFYIVFAFLLLNKKFGYILFFLWQSLNIVMLFYSDLKSSHFILSFIFNSYNILFLFGIIASKISSNEKYNLNRSTIPFILGNVIFILSAYVDVYCNISYDQNLLLYGLGSFFILVSSRNELLNSFFKNKRTLLIVGNASFSVYLIHLYVIIVSTKLINFLDFNTPMSLSVMYILTFLLSILLGIVVHLFIEKNLILFTKKIINKKWIKNDTN